MYVKIHRSAENKGSCKDLVTYLEKENRGINNPIEKEHFFSHTDDQVSAHKVELLIDSNKKGLKKDEAKFFMLTVNPSEAELAHIKNNHEKLKSYTREVMNEYASAMNRTLDGRPMEGKDLVYFAKLETERTYKLEQVQYRKELEHNLTLRKEINRHKDSNPTKAQALEKEYLRDSAGTVILPGNKREGLQTHVHIIVSRKDQSKRLSLSPLAASRGSQNELNGKKVQVGFNREQFVDRVEKRFDQQFSYPRAIDKSFQYHYANQKYSRQFSRLLFTPLEADKMAKSILSKSIQNPELRKLLYVTSSPTAAFKAEVDKQAVKALATVIQANPAGLPMQVLKQTLTKVGHQIARASGIGLG